MRWSKSIPFYSPEEEQPGQLATTLKVRVRNQTDLIFVRDTFAKTQLVENIIVIYNGWALHQEIGEYIARVFFIKG